MMPTEDRRRPSIISRVCAPPLAVCVTLMGVGVMTVSTPVLAQGPISDEAREHLDQGLENYEAGNYDDAIEHFKAGYELDPLPDFLFGWAQAERLAGRCEQAIVQYRRIIDAGASERQAEVVNGFIDECETKLAAEREAEEERRAEEERQRQEEQAAAEQAEQSQEGKDRGWARDPVGGVLVGVGAAAIVGGIGLLAAASVRESSLENASTYDEFASEYDRAERSVPAMRIAGSVVLVAGAGLVVGGVIRYLKKSRESGVETAGVWSDGRSAGVMLRGHF